MKWAWWMLLAWSVAAAGATWEEHLATGRKALFAGNAGWAAQELEHALRLSGQAGPSDQARIRFYLGIAQLDLGNFERAEASQRSALGILEAQSPRDDRALAVVSHQLANALHSQGRFREAESFHRRSIALTEKGADADQLTLARSLNGLAAALVQLDRQPEAQGALKRARSILAKRPDADLADLIDLNLADSLRSQGRLAEAEPLYRASLGRLARRAGAADPDAAAARIGLGLVLLARGAAEGEKVYRQGMALYANRLGERHPAVVKYKEQHARLQRK
jgi:tetratricopeptide (TPR) repeat protein